MHPLQQLVDLQGNAYMRGMAQATLCPELADAVRSAIRGRLADLAPRLGDPASHHRMRAQAEFLRAHDPEGHDESRGIAEGFGIPHADLLAYLHGNVIADMVRGGPATAPAERDGCSAWAHTGTGAGVAQGALVVKNRDYRGEHGRLQKVFRHSDPAWGARTLLCLGSLGSPGAFSSGMNSQGLAVVDTQIGTRDHGTGWLRYFLMGALLRQCDDVPQALAMVRAVPHAGGGSLVMGDRHGNVAAVELGHHQGPAVFEDALFVAHTNHYLDPALQADYLPVADDLADSSEGRLRLIATTLRGKATPTAADARTLMATHAGNAGVCRHASEGRAGTLSCAIYDTLRLRLEVSDGPPCEGRWIQHTLQPPTFA